MKRSLVISLALVIVLLASVGIAPASTVSAAKPQTFTNVPWDVWPLGAPNNVQHGNSDRWRTIEEYYGGIIYSGPIGGMIDLMSITTNFVQADTVGPFSGPFHATMEITTFTGEAVTLNVTGKIEGHKGFTPYGLGINDAIITGRFNSTAGKHVNGTLEYIINWDTFTFGGTLSGTSQ